MKVTEICDGCGLCASSCPLDVITGIGGGVEIGVGCNLCGTCAALCPMGAIKKV